MARYFFDIDDGRFHRDPEGTECATLGEVRQEAMRALAEIARDAIPADGDRQVFTLSVRDGDGRAVYEATLNYAGRWADMTR